MKSKPPKKTFDELDRKMCSERWKKHFGSGPPKYSSVEFMRKVLAFEAQVADCGGHPRAVRHALKESLREPRNQKAKVETKLIPSPATLQPGTYLVREWNGHIYQVEVTSDGFQVDGKRYGSLTAIAREITGSGWSGPRFFGLAKA